jgi:drug/metabolite transporter (DMT)-like permease
MLVLANVLWSLNYATTKLAFRGWNPLAFALSRFMVAGVIFSAYVWWREGSLAIRRADMPLLVAASAVGICLNQLTFNYAVDNTTAGNVALILASAPAFAALFASALRHEHVRPRHFAALGVSAIGVGIVIQGGSGVHGFSLIGGFMLAPFGIPQALSQDWGRLGAVSLSTWAYSTVFPLLVTNLLYFRSLRRVGASRATLYMYLQPFLGALFAAALIGESVTPVQVAGGVVIVLGVSLGQLLPGAALREEKPASAGAQPQRQSQAER